MQARATVLPPTPASATACWARGSTSLAIRRASRSLQREFGGAAGPVPNGPVLLLPVPSTTEPPVTTTAPAAVLLRTSTAVTSKYDVVVAVNAVGVASFVRSPAPAGVR